MRAAIEAWIHRQWAKRGLLALLLSPFSLIFLIAVRWHFQRIRPVRVAVPVVVVGNIYVGGTGKTPITINLVQQLVKAGLHPGVISRGYKSEGAGTRLVTDTSRADEVGDEPLLIEQATHVPVAVNRDRVAAAQLLLQEHPEVDVIVSDDGLQHRRLARDVELAVVGARGLGNGWVLPAGPLREPPSRLDTVDAIILNATSDTISSRTPRFAATSQLGRARHLASGRTQSLNSLSRAIRKNKQTAQAAAGIALPDRFFSMLRAHDIECEGVRLADHCDFAVNPFKSMQADVILITGKDAVKCKQIPEIANDERIWVAELEVSLDEFLIKQVLERITAAKKEHAS